MPASIASTTYLCFGSGYISGGLIMVSAIIYYIDNIPRYYGPPTITTSLSFTLKAGNVSNLVLFAWALGITAILLGLERYAL
jgi:hypothetical protein